MKKVKIITTEEKSLTGMMANKNKNGIFSKLTLQFIRIIASTAIILSGSFSLIGAQTNDTVTIFVISDASDLALKQPPVVWAIGQLQEALQKKDIVTDIRYNLASIHEPGDRIIVTPGESGLAQTLSNQRDVDLPTSAESLALISGHIQNEKVLMITGADMRGLVYAILELSDRVAYSKTPIAMLRGIQASVEQPVNSIRSMTRLFVSNVEDKSWFYDKTFWESYLSMLVTQRFNRFSLTLGLGYDSPKEVLDSYFIFAYPYLVDVPGYSVRVRGLTEGEREKNLAMLQFISEEASRRGLHFQLGLWGHAYESVNSPDVNYIIEGLTEDTHAEYCRNAVRTLLQACPAIDGITFRAHYESGIPDGSKSFWETVFQGVAECGRRVEIDLHAKGITYEQTRMALSTGMPVRVTPKLTAEHMGLPAHQAAIREMERVPSPNNANPRNSIARYGYADFLSNDRNYGVYYRLWPGMQKILLWGDPVLAAGYGRYASFCGSLGMEVSEPLSFKGRQGSGVSPERRIYADDSLIPEGGNWRKYLYTYRIWGRHLYNPDADPESYRRYLRAEFGTAALNVEKALAHASRVLPLITSSHLPAGSAMTYWPEMYTNMPITQSGLDHPYGDTPKPKVFGRVSPLDPAMFSSANEFVDDLIEGRPHARYSPVEVASWLEGFATVSTEQLSLAQQNISDPTEPSFRRVIIDVSVQSGLGMFFAQKLRATVAFRLHEEKGDLEYLRDAVYFYRAARSAWANIIQQTENVYVDKLGFGQFPHIRGHWKDRLPAIDQDLNYMEQLLRGKIGESAAFPKEPSTSAREWLDPRPPMSSCEHPIPVAFDPGQPLELTLASLSPQVHTAKIHYRHVNQVEAYQIETMSEKDGVWRYTIPGGFTDSQYPLMYFFELLDDSGHAWFYPGFEPDLANQPYYHVQRSK